MKKHKCKFGLKTTKELHAYYSHLTLGSLRTRICVMDGTMDIDEVLSRPADINKRNTKTGTVKKPRPAISKKTVSKYNIAKLFWGATSASTNTMKEC